MVRHPVLAGHSGVHKLRQMGYYVYVLKSVDGRNYIGQTNDLERRLCDHNRGHVKATRNRRPLKFIFIQEFEYRSKAMKQEKYLKSLKGGNEFKKIISG